MKIGKLIFVLLSLVIIVAGCSTSGHKVACTGENWHQIGYDFASQGESVRRFDAYRDQCGESLEDGAMSAYLDGYTGGLVEYCTYDKGYDRGFNVKQPIENCPVEMQAQYAEGYKAGQAAQGRRILELEETMRRYERYFDDQRQRQQEADQEAAERAGRAGF